MENNEKHGHGDHRDGVTGGMVSGWKCTHCGQWSTAKACPPAAGCPDNPQGGTHGWPAKIGSVQDKGTYQCTYCLLDWDKNSPTTGCQSPNAPQGQHSW